MFDEKTFEAVMTDKERLREDVQIFQFNSTYFLDRIFNKLDPIAPTDKTSQYLLNISVKQVCKNNKSYFYQVQFNSIDFSYSELLGIIFQECYIGSENRLAIKGASFCSVDFH